MSSPFDLPQIEPEGFERADAARNRERILSAARRLFDERGAGHVSMDEIAEAAGVGKGTLFRRFGSRAALAAAVLSERERDFQEAIIRGEPPLGPGAPPCERLIAFGEALLETLEAHSEVLLAAETGAARFAHPAYRVHRLHVMLLLSEADPECDSEMLAETLLAALGAELFTYLRQARGISLERLKDSWAQQVRRTVVAPAPV
ncbi:MAG TPA: helix-turn-helix domain-containing protein [Solirubrobacteraceae bacterium]|jgi:AcrR family transcriptional regulator|nr:helix-turn-helix domain-containing protein [Solirubrobacteraceae bacterium]